MSKKNSWRETSGFVPKGKRRKTHRLCRCAPCLAAGESRDGRFYCDDCGGVVDPDTVPIVAGGSWS
jgi:hypothetical protein